MPLHQWVAEWSQWFWPRAGNHLWQTTLCVVVALLAVKLLDRAPARVRYAILLLAFSKFWLPSSLLLSGARQIGLSLAWPNEEMPSTTFISQAAQPFSESLTPSYTLELITGGVAAVAHQEFYCLLTLVWLLGATVFLAHWLRRRQQFAQALQATQCVTAGPELAVLRRVQAQLRMKRKVGLVISATVVEPGVWRAWRPVIVLPTGLAATLSEAELEAVLLHELIHIRHWDNLLGTWQMVGCCLCWFHPLIWWLDRRLLAERELVCDEQVVGRVGAAQTYAASLWKVAQFGLGWPIAGVSRATGSDLKRRVERILKTDYPRKLALPQRLLVSSAVATLVALSFALGTLPRVEVWAQGQQSKSGESVEPETNLGKGSGTGSGSGKGIGAGKGAGIGKGAGSGNQTINVADATPRELAELPRIQAEKQDYEAHTTPAVVDAKVTPSGQPEKQDQQESNPKPLPPKWQMIRQAPAFPMQIDNSNGAPLLISQASVKTMLEHDREYQPLSAPEQADKVDYLISQFYVTLLNQTDKAVKRFQFEIENPGMIPRLKWPVTSTSIKQTIAAYDSHSFGDESLHHYTLKPGPFSPTAFTVRVVKVEYEDGSVWETRIALNNNPKQAPQEPEVIYEISQVTTRPEITYRAWARYPKEARDKKTSGPVTLSAVFRKDGVVTNIRVIRGLPHGLTEQAIAMAQKTRFKPATKDGQAVSVRTDLYYYFTTQ
jgi:TonB family protein